MVSVGWWGEGACEAEAGGALDLRSPWSGLSSHSKGQGVAGWGLPAAQSVPPRPAPTQPLRGWLVCRQTESPEVQGSGGAAGLVCGLSSLHGWAPKA